CMTVLALKTCRSANAVSELHGVVSRQMWQCLWPDKKLKDVPIGHITNGIHTLFWMKGPMRRFWRRKLMAHSAAEQPFTQDTAHVVRHIPGSWDAQLNHPDFWARVADPKFISDEEIWSLRYRLRRELIEFT